MVSSRIIALAVCYSGGRGVGGLAVMVEDKGMSHSPLSVRRPSMITLLFFSILTLNLEKIAMQSSSQSCPRDMRDPVWISSNMITCWALADNSGEILSWLSILER